MFEIVSSILLGLAGVIMYAAYRKYQKLHELYKDFPGRPNPHWFFGHLKEFPGESEAGINYNVDLTKHYPRFCTFWVSGFMCVLIFHHPETVKLLLKSSAPKPRKPGTIYVFGLPWLGEGLLIANGDRWTRNRKLLTPAFHFDILQPYTQVHNQCVDILLERLQTVSQNNGGIFDGFEYIGLCSLDIILRCAFSSRTDAQTRGDDHPYVKAVHRLTELWVKRSLNVFHYLDWIYFSLTSNGREFIKLCNYVQNVANDIIQKRKNVIEKEGIPNNDGNKKRCLDFLDMLITARDENGEGLSDEEIRCEVDTFLFEGHDTTNSGITFTLLCLAENPEYQDKVRQEIDDILYGRDTDYIQWKDLAKLEYLTMCIKETLRHYSPVHVIQREITEEFCADGYNVPVGTNVVVNIHNLHHNPTIWGDDYNMYKPDRFLPENIQNMDPFAFVPFSAGPRNCIGQNFAMMEMKIMIARIIHRFKVETVPGHVYKKKSSVVMKSENGVLLKLIPRDK
ncbi:hypothetical protein ACF0H5_019385 [Mactra antiquata]